MKRGLRQALGRALRELRASHKQSTQETLANHVGMDRSYWAYLERGDRSTGLFGLWQLAGALGISPASLVRAIDKHYRQMDGLLTVTPRTPVDNAIKSLRDFMDQSSDMMWFGSPHAKTAYCNVPMLHYLGLTLADLEGKSAWQEVIHPDDRQQYVAKNSKAYACREPHLSRYRMRGADGQYRTFVEHAVPQFTAKGLFIGFLGTMIQEPESTKKD